MSLKYSACIEKVNFYTANICERIVDLTQFDAFALGWPLGEIINGYVGVDGILYATSHGIIADLPDLISSLPDEIQFMVYSNTPITYTSPPIEYPGIQNLELFYTVEGQGASQVFASVDDGPFLFVPNGGKVTGEVLRVRVVMHEPGGTIPNYLPAFISAFTVTIGVG